MAELTNEQKKALAMAAARKRQQQGATAYSGSILPFSRDQSGTVQFDSNAGILGVAKRAFQYPGQVARGEIDPLSDEGIQRNIEFATVASPMNPGVRAGDRAIPGMARAMRKDTPVPTMEQLRASGGKGFDAIKEMNVSYAPRDIQNLAIKIQSELAKDGFTPRTAKQTFGELNRLARAPSPGAGEQVTMPLQNLNSARSVFGNIARGRAGNPDEAAAEIVKRRISEFIESPPGGSVLSGDAAKASQVAKNARGDWAAAKRSAAIQGIDERTANQAAAAYSGGNVGNNIRQRLAQFLANDKATRGFSKQELEAVKAIVEGNAQMNASRRASNMLGGGGGLGSTVLAGGGAGLGAAMGLSPTGVAAATVIPPAAGLALRAYYNRLVTKALKSLDESVRMRSPLYEELVRQTPALPVSLGKRAAPVRGLLATSASGSGGGGGY